VSYPQPLKLMKPRKVENLNPIRYIAPQAVLALMAASGSGTRTASALSPARKSAFTARFAASESAAQHHQPRKPD